MNKNEQQQLIETGTVHLYCSGVDISEGRFDDCASVLSSEERIRAGKYHFDKDRRQFIVARGLLRTLLGGYLGVLPANIKFDFEKFGKPFLHQEKAKSCERLHFNVAHSGNHILFGFSSDGELGVDVEELRIRRKPLLDLADSICTSKELEWINGLDPAAAEIALTRLWTAKEAFLKAIGSGLQVEPKRIEVQSSVLHGNSDPIRIRRIDAPNPGNGYVLYPLPDCELRIHCSGALAASGDVRVVWRDLN